MNAPQSRYVSCRSLVPQAFLLGHQDVDWLSISLMTSRRIFFIWEKKFVSSGCFNGTKIAIHAWAGKGAVIYWNRGFAFTSAILPILSGKQMYPVRRKCLIIISFLVCQAKYPFFCFLVCFPPLLWDTYCCVKKCLMHQFLTLPSIFSASFLLGFT